MPAFYHTGVDVFGPITVTVGRPSVKRWICLFTCFNTCALHLEVLFAMSTDSFLMALGRFFSLYGTPHTITSDNGRNFVGGARAIDAAIDPDKVQKTSASKGITWSFITPASPHHGGVWERLVKHAKYALKNMLSQERIDDEMLTTIIDQVNGLINCRYISHVSASPHELKPITPNHLIYGHALAATFTTAYQDIDVPLKHVRQVSTTIRRFWRRWIAEYLPSLMEHSKWRLHKPNLRNNDVVLVVNDTALRGKWLLGRIVKIYPSKDDIVRSVRVKIGNGEYDRPVAKLCPLKLAADALGVMTNQKKNNHAIGDNQPD